MPPTQLRGEQIADGTIASADIDDAVEKEFTKVRISTDDSTPNFLSTKIVAGANVTVSTTGVSGSNQTLTIASTGGGSGTPATSVTNETTFAIVPVIGVSTNYARQDHTHGSVSLGLTSGSAAAGNDSRLSDSRTPTGDAGGQLGGTFPNPDVRGIRETAGPTLLTLGAVTDGQVLQRVGATVVGVWLSAAFSFAGSAEVESPSVTTVPGVVSSAGVVS